MTIHPLYQDSTAASSSTAYDSVWAQTEVPAQQPEPFEQVMLAEDKLFVVLAVVLIIWLGLIAFLYRTDRKLDRLEQSVEANIPDPADRL